MSTVAETIAAIMPELKAAAYRIAHGKSWHMDMMQDCIVRAIESSGAGAENAAKNQSEMLAYMVTAMCRYRIDKQRERVIPVDDATFFERRTTDVDLSARADNELIDFAINFLPEPDRQIFILYAFVDFDFNVVSAETGIPIRSLYNSVHRSKTKLRSWLVKT